MNLPTSPTMRPTTAKILAIVGQIDRLSTELAKVAATAEDEDGSAQFTPPEWDEINEHFGAWLDGWLDYAFGRMRARFVESGYMEL